MLNFMLDNLTVAQSEFAEHFLCFFLFYKKVISIKFSILNTCKCSFQGGYATWLQEYVLKMGGIQVLAGLASFTQTAGSLLRTSWW
jgi:hypothetical protein